jgi:FkbM family methyltransferase
MWHTQANAWGGRFETPTADRLLYVWLHRLGMMGSERAFLQEHVRPGMVVADIGANIGLYTYLLSRCVADSGFVYSFEPAPELFAALTRNCDINGVRNVALHSLALGARSDTLILKRSLVNSGDNRLSEGGARGAVGDVTVPVRALDELLAGRSLDFVKIDVQGWEFEVLKGMRNTLAASSDVQIYFEFWPAGIRRTGHEPRELLEFLRKQGFQVHRAEGLRIGARFDDVHLERSRKGSEWTNLLAVR